LEQLRDFINIKLDQSDGAGAVGSQMVLLCGDLNINSRPSNPLAELKAQFEENGRNLNAKEEKILEQAENEYQTMLHILSNFGEETIKDCLQENLDNRKGQADLIDVTYGDSILDDKGQRKPRETGLTNSDDFGCAERLDYILQLEIKPDQAGIKVETNET
jgi:hypothetical protein